MQGERNDLRAAYCEDPTSLGTVTFHLPEPVSEFRQSLPNDEQDRPANSRCPPKRRRPVRGMATGSNGSITALDEVTAEQPQS